MKTCSLSRTHFLLTQLLIMASLVPGQGLAQEVSAGLKDAYFRAVGEHFQLPLQEVTIVGEWELAPEEVPVVLFLADRAGLSPDALIGLRRSGRPWMDIATRFGLGAAAFHLPLPEGEPLGVLARACGEFRSRPAREWTQIQLTDPEIIALVNLRVLAERAGVPPLRVLRAREEAGSFMAAYPLLRGR